MKKLCNEKEIFTSWRHCVQSGLRPDIKQPPCPLTNSQLEKLLRECGFMSAVLENSVKGLENMLTARPAFFLTDMRGVLIKKNTGKAVLCRIPGRDFAGGAI